MQVTAASLLGVWTRRWIRWPDGRGDDSTRVFWLQGNPGYADIRIPAHRPSFAGVGSLDDCSPSQRAWLATQQGFAGTLNSEERAWLWQRELDFQPPSGKRDIGRLTFQNTSGQLLLEEGADEPYTELWERIDDGASSNGHALVLRSENEKQRGLFIAVGRHFLLARDLGGPLNVELSHGPRDGEIQDWIIADSTFPWREGLPVFDHPTLDWSARILRDSTTEAAWKVFEPTEEFSCIFSSWR